MANSGFCPSKPWFQPPTPNKKRLGPSSFELGEAEQGEIRLANSGYSWGVAEAPNSD